MYSGFFGLRELPFNNTPDPRFFYSSPDHEEALASLIYTVQERKGIVFLTGEVGTGKTTVTRMMTHHFGSRSTFATIQHAIRDAQDLLESISIEFGLDGGDGWSHARVIRQIHDFLTERYAQDVPVALILDEAQNLPLDVLEELRMLENLEADNAKLLQVIMVGQPEFRRRLASRELRPLQQRAFRLFHIGAMDAQTTAAYIGHRLNVSGPPPRDIFEPGAIKYLFEMTRGIPRAINSMCDHAMLCAYSADRRTIDHAFLKDCVRQMEPVVLNIRSKSDETAKVDEDSGVCFSPDVTENQGPAAHLVGNQTIALPYDDPVRRTVNALRKKMARLDAKLQSMPQPDPHSVPVSPSVNARAPGEEPAVTQRIENRMQTLARSVEGRVDHALMRLNQLTRNLAHGVPPLNPFFQTAVPARNRQTGQAEGLEPASLPAEPGEVAISRATGRDRRLTELSQRFERLMGHIRESSETPKSSAHTPPDSNLDLSRNNLDLSRGWHERGARWEHVDPYLDDSSVQPSRLNRSTQILSREVDSLLQLVQS